MRRLQRSSVGLYLLLASLATAATAQPPWSAEAPGAADSRFGLGLDVFFERQESLEIESALSTVTLRSPGGQESRMTVPGDPALLNRKFDIVWEMAGAGVDVPIALPTLGLPGSPRLYSTLSLQASVVDVSLDFLDRSRSQDSTALDGRGELFGTGLDLAAYLCSSCSWYAAGGYRFQKIPWMSVDRSPLFTLSGAEVLHDEVRLSRQTQDLSLGIGYVSPAGRFASYAGARRRWTDLDVDDELRFVDREQETSLASRTQLGSEVVLGYAGVDAHLWGSVYGQAEAMYSEDDWGALLRMVYLWPRERRDETEPDTPEDEEDRQPTEAEQAELEQRATEIADAVEPQIKSIHSEFRLARGPLSASLSIAAAHELLRQMEQALLEALSGPDLAAMRDYVQDRFRHARELLDRKQDQTLFNLVPAVMRDLDRPVAARVSMQRSSASQNIDDAFDLVEKVLDRLGRLFENNDLLVDVCFQTRPKIGARIQIQPQSYPPGVRKLRATNGDLRTVWRGLYVHHVSRSGYRTIDCLSGSPSTGNCDPLDLVMIERPWVLCNLEPSGQGECFVDERPSGSWRCEADGR